MKRMAVLDCSITAAWFLPEENSSYAERLLRDICSAKMILLLPSLWWYEILNVLRSAVLRKRIDEKTAQKSLFLLKEIPVNIIDPEKQGQFALFDLALKETISIYDAAYLHLALISGADLFTSDTDQLRLQKRYVCIKHPKEYADLDE